jgi:hypothetical protein
MQNPNVFSKSTITWRTSIAFVLVATSIAILVGWLSSSGVLPIHQTIEYSDAGLKFIQVWIQIAIAIGVIIPAIAFVVWFKDPQLRTIFGFYLLLLIIQIFSEQIVSSFWLSSLVVVFGTLYTVFRVWQLWQGLRLIKTTQQQAKHKFAIGLLWLLLLFWSSNLIMLLTLGWSSIL